MLDGWVLGLHLISAHPGVEGMNNVNPGVYAVAPSGLTFGAYRNSYCHLSMYAGWTFRHEPFFLTVAGVTGYDHIPIAPLIGVGVKLPSGFRLLAGPTDKGKPVFHLSWEKDF